MKKKNYLTLFQNNKYSFVDKNNVPIGDYTLCITYPEDFIKYTTSNVVKINTQNGEELISLDLLSELINNPALYSLLYDCIKNNYGITIMSYESSDRIFINNVTLNLALKNYIDILAKDNSINKYKIDALITNNLEYKRNLRNIINILINQKSYQINEQILIEILELSEENYQKFLNGEGNYPYPSNEMYMLLIEYIKNTHLLEKYELPENIVNRVKQLTNGMLYEKNASNSMAEFINKIDLNDQLYDHLTRGIVKSDSNIEKVIKVYDTLCNTYTSFDLSSNTLFSENLDKLNNKEVSDTHLNSNEFLLLISYILNSLNIKYSFGKKTMIISDNQYQLEINFAHVKEDMENGITEYQSLISKNDVSIENDKLNELIQSTIIKNREIMNNQYISKNAIDQYQNTNSVDMKSRLSILFGYLEKNNDFNYVLVKKLKRIIKNVFNGLESLKIKCFSINNDVIIFCTYNSNSYIFSTNDKKVRKSTSEELENIIGNNNVYEMLLNPTNEMGVENVRKIS